MFQRFSASVAASAAAVAAAALVVIVPAVADAATPGARLTATVRPTAGPARVAWLTCAPTGGNHRNAPAACADLVAAGGYPRRIQPTDGMCTMEHAPVKVTLRGRWYGRSVRYERTFGNGCAMRLATRAVFAL